ncbi:MAG: hypothetical protein K5640_01905 [Treponema sp.]|nr:hypothetical protein [Treponema sp.]
MGSNKKSYRKPAVILMAFAIFSIRAVCAFSQSNKTTVYNISAAADSDKAIKITWEFQVSKDKSVQAFELYRANKPFSTTWELSGESKIAELDANQRSYTDEIKDYHEYYYAVTVKTPDGEDRILLPSINATVNGVHRKMPQIKKQSISSPAEKEKIYPEGSIREIPLPAIAMLEDNNKEHFNLNIQSIRAGEALISNKNEDQAHSILEPFAFEEDLLSPESGDDYLLFDTLHRTFAKRKYNDGVIQLKDFLSVNHSQQVSDRACFYLGECQYFSGSFREAIMSFLKVQDSFPELCQKWIDSSLDLIDISDITY